MFSTLKNSFVPGSGVRDWTQSIHQGEIIPSFLEMLQLKFSDSEWCACRQTVEDWEQRAKILFLLKSDDVRPLLFVGHSKQCCSPVRLDNPSRLKWKMSAHQISNTVIA